MTRLVLEGGGADLGETSVRGGFVGAALQAGAEVASRATSVASAVAKRTSRRSPKSSSQCNSTSPLPIGRSRSENSFRDSSFSSRDSALSSCRGSGLAMQSTSPERRVAFNLESHDSTPPSSNEWGVLSTAWKRSRAESGFTRSRVPSNPRVAPAHTCSD